MTPISMEGHTLGKYRILEPLGRGGMAQVYRAYHPALDRYVAIKILRTDLVEETEFLNRFHREARSIAALRHPNIVQVYDFDFENDLYYMVMELLEGNTLKAYMNAFRLQNRHIPLNEMTRIFLDTLDGLAYAHSEGIIHRDIKPANIMLTKQGQAVLTDFGIAQILDGTQYTVSGAIMGTLNYMAPEQGKDGISDIRSDIYSLGITCYEALTGTVPFDADTPLAILMKHLNDALPMPRTIDPEIPEPYERVVLKSLAKKPDDRFQSATEMAEALIKAAQKTALDVPIRLSIQKMLPMPKTNSSQVGVFSGSARLQISDSGFASDDTDITTGRKTNHKSSPTTIKAKGDQAVLQEINGVENKYISQALFGSITAIMIVNIIIIWASGIYGWDLFNQVWPMELIGIGCLLIALMAAFPQPWLIIPGGIVMGNGFLFTYFALTGYWHHWTYMWPLEPLLIACSIVAPFWLKRKKQRGLWLTRRIGIVMLASGAILFVITMIFTFIRSASM